MLRLVREWQVRRIANCQALLELHCPLHSASTGFLQIKSNGFQNDKREIDFDLLFSSCTNLRLAKCLHALIVVSGKAHGTVIPTRLVNRYSNLGDVSLSRRTFDRMENRNLYTWNSMVSAFVLNSRFREALDCFGRLVGNSGLRPDFYTFPPVLKACGNALDGKKVHCSVLKLGFQYDVFVSASLIHMYSRFGILDVARKLFTDMPVRDLGCWNAMISGYCQNGRSSEALDILHEMRLEGVAMNSRTVATLLPICAQSGDVLGGMLIHLYVIKHGFSSHLFVSNGLINMYAKFGNLKGASSVFDQMRSRDVVSWNSIIAAHEQNDDPTTALSFFNQMQVTGLSPDLFTLASLISIFTRLSDHRNSRSVHAFIIMRGWLVNDTVLGNAVVDMYGKLGLLDSAVSVFQGLPAKDTVSWNTMITSYAQNDLPDKAIEAYHAMQYQNNAIPNQETWVSVLPAFTSIGALQQGMKIHASAIKKRLETDVKVSTSLIDMYGKCGRLHDAVSIFHDSPQESLSPWNAMISCHGIHGNGTKALSLFREMVGKNMSPDGVTFLSLLSACSHSGLVSEGQWCFRAMQEVFGVVPGMKHYGSMVDLLGRAGFLEMALEFIGKMEIEPDGTVWGALLGACRIHGNDEIGAFASDRVLGFDSGDVGYYVLASNVYAGAGKWERAGRVRAMARGKGLKKAPGWSSVEVKDKIEVFFSNESCVGEDGEFWLERISEICDESGV